MGVSRVDFDGETLVDLTGDTVTPQSLLSGYSAHNKAGELIEGLAVIPTKVSELKNDSKFITETGDSSKTTVTFEQAVKRANVNSGDDLSTAFSKLSKFCNDLKPHAFSAPSSDLLTTVPGFSLDATMGKKLKDLHDANKDEIDEINSKLSSLFVEVSGTSLRTNITALELKPFQITFPIPDGYQFHSVKSFYISGWSGLVLQGISTSGNNVVFHVYNTREATRECVVSAIINCITVNT